MSVRSTSSLPGYAWSCRLKRTGKYTRQSFKNLRMNLVSAHSTLYHNQDKRGLVDSKKLEVHKIKMKSSQLRNISVEKLVVPQEYDM